MTFTQANVVSKSVCMFVYTCSVSRQSWQVCYVTISLITIWLCKLDLLWIKISHEPSLKKSVAIEHFRPWASWLTTLLSGPTINKQTTTLQHFKFVFWCSNFGMSLMMPKSLVKLEQEKKLGSPTREKNSYSLSPSIYIHFESLFLLV